MRFPDQKHASHPSLCFTLFYIVLHCGDVRNLGTHHFWHACPKNDLKNHLVKECYLDRCPRPIRTFDLISGMTWQSESHERQIGVSNHLLQGYVDLSGLFICRTVIASS